MLVPGLKVGTPIQQRLHLTDIPALYLDKQILGQGHWIR